jgi:hypothetical protein
MWPAIIVQRLVRLLPDDYTAEPRVHLGAYFEIDVCAYENAEPKGQESPAGEDSGGVATARLASLQPTYTTDVDLEDQYEYEVRVYDQGRGRHLVAAVRS